MQKNKARKTARAGNTSRGETLKSLFMVFFKASSFTFAGGLAMLPAIEKELVKKRKLLDEERFIESVALSQTLPGMIALNCAVFVGSDCAGFLGALVAGLGALLPAYVFMLLATIFYSYVPQGSVVQGVLAGIRVASSALILYTGYSLGKRVIKDALSVIILILAFIAVFFLKVDVFPVMIASLLVGFLHALFIYKKSRR